MYAINAMRMEKGYGHWKADIISEFNPIEAGLGRFVDMSKEYDGKPGLMAQLSGKLRKQRVMLLLDSTSAPAQPGEGVFINAKPVGSITSAAWGYRVNSNLAMAYIDPQYAAEGTVLEVILIGEPTRAHVCKPCIYDPDNTIPQGTHQKQIR
jgi:dimethylglycine dehydrogenase